MEISVKGSCICGAVTFQARGEPLFQGYCQCADCRKGGSGHGAAITMRREAVSISGTTARYEMRGDSGSVKHRNFCPICGTGVFNSYPGAGEAISLNAALLDNPELFVPQVVLYADSGLPWDHLDPALPRSEARPAARSD